MGIHVQGDLVYVHSATDEDFKLIRDFYKIDLTGRIVIARYGASYRGAKVSLTQDKGGTRVSLTQHKGGARE